MPDVNLLAARPPYLGQVATGCYMPRSAVTTANAYARTRDLVITTEAVTNPKVGWARWRVASGVESQPSGDCTFIAALEYPTGVFTYADQNIAAGSPGSPAAVNMAAGEVLLLDFSVTIPKGARVYLWCLQVSIAGGILFRQGQSSQIARPGCYLHNGTGTPPGLLDAFPGQPGEYSFPPVLFLGMTRKPSVLMFADSREEGGQEGPRPPFYDNGMILGAIGRYFGYSSMAESGDWLSRFIANTKTKRLALAQYFTHVVNAYGVNDFNQGRTVAQLLADRASFAALFPNNIVVGSTIMPYTGASTDAWLTTANQGLGTNQPKIREANRSIRAGISGEQFILDTARAVDPYDRDKWPPALDPSATAAPYAACQFTGSISGTTLTITAIANGVPVYGMVLADNLTGAPYTGAPYPGTTILEQLTGTAGSTGTYRVSVPQTVASKTMYSAGIATQDGLHFTGAMAEQGRERLDPALRQFV